MSGHDVSISDIEVRTLYGTLDCRTELLTHSHTSHDLRTIVVINNRYIYRTITISIIVGMIVGSSAGTPCHTHRAPPSATPPWHTATAHALPAAPLQPAPLHGARTHAYSALHTVGIPNRARTPAARVPFATAYN
jgi:hypothetical protein